MGRRRDCVKALRRRKDYLEQKLQEAQNSGVIDYPGRQYDKAELSALDYVLKGLFISKKEDK